MAEKQGAVGVCEKNNYKPASNLLQTVLSETQRRVWLFFEISQGSDNTA